MQIYVNIAVIVTAVVGYIILLAAQSPQPLLRTSVVGSVTVIAACIVASALLAYTRTALAQVKYQKGLHNAAASSCETANRGDNQIAEYSMRTGRADSARQCGGRRRCR